MLTFERTASTTAPRMTQFLCRCIPRVYLEFTVIRNRSMVATKIRNDADVMAQWEIVSIGIMYEYLQIKKFFFKLLWFSFLCLLLMLFPLIQFVSFTDCEWIWVLLYKHYNFALLILNQLCAIYYILFIISPLFFIRHRFNIIDSSHVPFAGY